MKRFSKLFIILLCCVGAMSLTSCLNSDDDGGIDPETYATYLTLMSGSYNGYSTDYRYQNKIYFYNDSITDKNNVNKTDSVDGIYGRVNKADSTFTIYNVPGRVLAKEIPDSYKELRDAIEAAPAQNVTGQLLITDISSLVYFFAYPMSVEYDELTYGGETHKKIIIAFWGPTMGVFGNNINSHRILQLNLCPAAVYEDKALITSISSNNNQVEINRASLTVQVVD